MTSNLQKNLHVFNNAMKRDLNDAEIIENNKIDNIQNVIN
jgi:hypothetical protein